LRAKRSNPEAEKLTGLLRRLRLLAMTKLIELISIVLLRTMWKSPTLHFDCGAPLVFRGPLQRQIVVLFRGNLDMLVAKHRERSGDAAARRVRHDDIVDVTTLGGDEG
jgi:hypothetical protein